MQIFKDAACTEYLTTGEYDTVYVRLNRDFGLDGTKLWNYDIGGQSFGLFIFTPETSAPDDPYFINAFDTWYSADSTTPFVAGSVIPCMAERAEEIAEPHVIFYADGSSSVAP